MPEILEKIIALIFLILLSPIFLILYLAVKLTSKGPFIFKQKRSGKNKKPFYIYKIRTMVENAEELKEKYKHLNQADGPVFKIYDDPRFTKVGKIIAHLGLDELPQLINILKGEMSFVGPRPFPVAEAKRISKKYEKRFSVKPGILSSWVIQGAFHDNFEKWMNLDLKDVENKSFWYDLKIILKSLAFWVKVISNAF
ncbi:MAG: multidrug MFS transporter [Patescibacteria group bacterium]|nr:MAG: multidrug MFS transporter [Patescibacteria group bacterium]GIW63853.1 MAG: multidrug MFS transporter [Patescibacteria group bacterium]